MGGGLHVLSGPWLMLGICSLNVIVCCMRYLHFHNNVIEKEGEIQSEGCTDGQPKGTDGYQEDGQSPEYTDKGVIKVKKCLDERIDEGVLRWFGYVERMQNNRIAKRVYVGECAGSRSVD